MHRYVGFELVYHTCLGECETVRTLIYNNPGKCREAFAQAQKDLRKAYAGSIYPLYWGADGRLTPDTCNAVDL